jgi:hypothetical protein
MAFKTPHVKFTAYRNAKIIHISPYVKFCASEEAFFSQLLLFVPWKDGLEQNICGEDGAEFTWEREKAAGNIPDFAFGIIDRDLSKQSLDMLPVYDDTSDCSSGFDDEDMTCNVHIQQLLPPQETIMPRVKSSQLVCQNVIVDKAKQG